jgi:hypothetical protein
MPPLLLVLSSESSAASDQTFCKFAEFLGLRTELVALRGELTEPPDALLTPAPGDRVLALGRTALRLLYQRDWFARLLDEARFVFIYGFIPTGGESPELKWLTGGAVAAVHSLGAGVKQFSVHSDVAFGGFPVSGKSYSVESCPTAVFSGAAPAAGIESYITVNGHPLFVTAQRGSATVFLFTDADWVDIDMTLTPESTLRPWYAQLVAASIFLRSAFGDWCWTAPVTGATFIVDDPYLKRRYGFVHYETLVREFERTRGALTVAFIPYNHRRSDPQTVGLLRQHSDRISIAVHGCDHTGGEFASLDESWLAGTVTCALERMEAHTRQTGMPFDNVMIFPQGRFSTKAIGALKSCGFLAAVNSTAWPEDWHKSPLTIRDLLDVAVTRYESFPIFVRRYPRDVFDYAFDALFQKPILAVEHHGFFRNGYGALTEFIRDLSILEPKLQWMPLGRTLASSCVLRRTGDGQFTLRHYAPVLRFKNPAPADLSLSFEKPEQHGLVESVLVEGRKVPFEIDAGVLKYEAEVGAGKELHVTVLNRQTPRITRQPSWKYHLTTSIRRLLSDIRDNQLAGNERVLSFFEKLKGIIDWP